MKDQQKADTIMGAVDFIKHYSMVNESKQMRLDAELHDWLIQLIGIAVELREPQ